MRWSRMRSISSHSRAREIVVPQGMMACGCARQGAALVPVPSAGHLRRPAARRLIGLRLFAKPTPVIGGFEQHRAARVTDCLLGLLFAFRRVLEALQGGLHHATPQSAPLIACLVGFCRRAAVQVDSDGGRFPRHPPVAALPALALPRPHTSFHTAKLKPASSAGGVTFGGQPPCLARAAAVLPGLSRDREATRSRLARLKSASAN